MAIGMTTATNTANFSALLAKPVVSGIKPAAKMDPAAIDKVSKDFEATFIAQMMEPMFGDSMGDAAFGDKESGDIYKGMLSEQYGKIIQQAGGIGIAVSVKRELMQLQEHQS